MGSVLRWGLSVTPLLSPCSLLQPELLFLVRPDTPHPDNSHQQELRGTVKR